jgi:HAD superfamily hydrolase (TIGR01549 family)
MTKIKGILFDYGHTLVWFPHYKEIHLASARNIQKKIQALGIFIEVSKIQLVIEEFSHQRSNHCPKIEEEFREILSILNVKNYNYDDLQEIIQLHWRPYVQDARVRKDALELLKYLKARRFKLGIVANIWSGGMDPALEKLGLKEFFETTVASIDVGFEKPSPEIFQIALKSLGLVAEEVMMVGDNPVADIQGAHDIGMCTVRLMRGPNRTEPDIVVPDFRIKNLLALSTVVN